MSDTFENGIYIDGKYYDVPVIGCERSGSFLWKYAERTEDGVHKGEVLGVYFNYTLKFGSIVDPRKYNELYLKLSEPRSYHVIKMPGANGSMFTFQAYFSNIKDSVKRSKDGVNRFEGLSVYFVSKNPSRS